MREKEGQIDNGAQTENHNEIQRDIEKYRYHIQSDRERENERTGRDR